MFAAWHTGESTFLEKVERVVAPLLSLRELRREQDE